MIEGQMTEKEKAEAQSVLNAYSMLSPLHMSEAMYNYLKSEGLDMTNAKASLPIPTPHDKAVDVLDGVIICPYQTPSGLTQTLAMDTRETAIRNALIGLGWTPPGNKPKLTLDRIDGGELALHVDGKLAPSQIRITVDQQPGQLTTATILFEADPRVPGSVRILSE